MSDKVLVQRDGAVLTVTLNRPDKKNALDGDMYNALHDAFDAASADSRVRVVLLTGAGDAFTAGNDLKDFADWKQYQKPDEVPVVRLITRVLRFDKPLVAGVRGVAVGFGTTILLHCDVVVAARSAKFGLPFVRLGLVPEFGSSQLLPAIAGRARAGRVLLLGEPFGIDEADRMGLISEICDDNELEDKCHEVCAVMAAQAPAALRAIKGLLNPADRPAALDQVVAREIDQFISGLQSPEHEEAITAFFEKRPPNFGRSR